MASPAIATTFPACSWIQASTRSTSAGSASITLGTWLSSALRVCRNSQPESGSGHRSSLWGIQTGISIWPASRARRTSTRTPRPFRSITIRGRGRLVPSSCGRVGREEKWKSIQRRRAKPRFVPSLRTPLSTHIGPWTPNQVCSEADINTGDGRRYSVLEFSLIRSLSPHRYLTFGPSRACRNRSGKRDPSGRRISSERDATLD